jgi:hypothetical protein
MYCSRCGVLNPDKAGYCSNCGAQLNQEAVLDTVITSPLPAAPKSPAPANLPAGGMAIASLILGIIGIFLIPLASILGIVFGSIGIHQASRGQAGGRGKAIAGLALGIFGLLELVVFFLVIIIAAAVSDYPGPAQAVSGLWPTIML